MTEAEIIEFLQGLPEGTSAFDACEALSEESYRRGDLYTMVEANKMAMRFIWPTDTVQIKKEE
jgi:hypothetical protein